MYMRAYFPANLAQYIRLKHQFDLSLMDKVTMNIFLYKFMYK